MGIESREVSLVTINSGAIADLFAEEFEKLVANVADENTLPGKTRSITIKVSVKPTSTREMAATRVEVTSQLAPLKPHESTIVFTSDGEKVSAFTMDPGKQQPLEGLDENIRRFAASAGGNS
jgi:hypothetical protein